MMVKHRLTLRSVVLAAALVPATAIALRGQDVAAVRAQVERANALELEAIVEGDAAGAARFFVQDALLLPPDGSIIRGREAIERYWAPSPGTRITSANTETVRFEVEGNQATLVGTYTLSTESRDGRAAFGGTFFMVWRQVTAGEWRIVVDTWTSREVSD